ncbi:MAG: OsmC family protein [Acidibrevibacterium sp.]|uniref:OsmC family protein n=1 Tax=Acidibrevibacterium sp. TaxID=2606776 RepID=UPI003D0295C7
MDMNGRSERRFAVKITHQEKYQFLSEASEAGEKHGAPYLSDEPKPVGDNAGPSTPALLASAIGHCLSASLLECLKHAHVDVLSCRADAVAVVRPNTDGKPRIDHVEVTIRPQVRGPSKRLTRCEDVYKNSCTVTSSVERGIAVEVKIDWDMVDHT